VLSDVTDKALQSAHASLLNDRELTRRNGLNIITKSLGRVGKKAQPDDVEGFTKKIMANIETTTDA